MSKYRKLVATPIPQSEPLDDRQVKNSAGGFVYALDDWKRLDRFLILGSDAPTYYASALHLTRDNAAVVERCWAADPHLTAKTIVAISMAGRAPKNDPALFALAIGATSKVELARQCAFGALGAVARTGTHLFQFVGMAKALGKGWGRGMKRAVAQWYESRPADRLAFQMIKYRQREGYDHSRLLKTAHPRATGDDAEARAALYRWAVGKDPGEALPAVVKAHIAAMALKPGHELTALAVQHGLPWEALPTEALNDPALWGALLPSMGLTAMIRNLGAMTARGTLKPLSKEVEIVIGKLSDRDEIRRSRVHPYTILQALAVYRSGHGVKGSMTWQPVQTIVDALDQAFYAAFENVEATGKRILLALDVSSSMGGAMIGGVLSAREASAALALVTLRVENRTEVIGFTSAARRGTGAYLSMGGAGVIPLPISPRMRLDTVVREISGLPHGSTDCALPAIYADKEHRDVDAIVILTDNETWHGAVHPKTALERLRQNLGKPVRQIVVGMTSTGFSIADPADRLSLDLVGFDSNGPALMADFIRGSL